MTTFKEPELLINLASKLPTEPHKPFWEVVPMKKTKVVKAIKPKDIKRTLNRIDQFVEYSFVKKVGDAGDAVVSSKQDRDLALLLQINQRSPVYKDTVRVRFRRSEYLSTLYTIDNAIDMCREGKYDGMEIVQIDNTAIKKANKIDGIISWLIVGLTLSIVANVVLIAVILMSSVMK